VGNGGNGGNGGAGGTGGGVVIDPPIIVSPPVITPPSVILAPTPILVAEVIPVILPTTVLCAQPFGPLLGPDPSATLVPVIVDGIVVDFAPLCVPFAWEPIFDCPTAFYYYAPEATFYCLWHA
jgi:hypothetical protein